MSTNMSEEREGTVPIVTRPHYGLDLDKSRERDSCHGENRGETRGGGISNCNHTDTTRCHVSSNHDWALAVFELLQDPIPLVLLFVAVNSYLNKSALEIESDREEVKTYTMQAIRLGVGTV